MYAHSVETPVPCYQIQVMHKCDMKACPKFTPMNQNLQHFQLLRTSISIIFSGSLSRNVKYLASPVTPHKSITTRAFLNHHSLEPQCKFVPCKTRSWARTNSKPTRNSTNCKGTAHRLEITHLPKQLAESELLLIISTMKFSQLLNIFMFSFYCSVQQALSSYSHFSYMHFKNLSNVLL